MAKAAPALSSLALSLLLVVPVHAQAPETRPGTEDSAEASDGCIVFRAHPTDRRVSVIHNRCDEPMNVAWRDESAACRGWRGCRTTIRGNTQRVIDRIVGSLCWTAVPTPGHAPAPECD